MHSAPVHDSVRVQAEALTMISRAKPGVSSHVLQVMAVFFGILLVPWGTANLLLQI